MDIFQKLLDIHLTIINLQNWCFKCRVFINTMKTKCLPLYCKKKKAAQTSILLTIKEIPLNFFCQRVLGIVGNENLNFITHIKNITQKCKKSF